MGAKVKFDTRKIIPKLMVSLNKSISKKTLLDSLAEFLQLRIYQFTKRGKSLALEGAKIKELSPGYKKWRRKVFKNNGKLLRDRGSIRFGDFFSPNRSNLTLTGQMLDALTHKTIPSDAQMVVTVKNTARKNDELSNSQVAKEVAENGRPFLGIDTKTKDIVRRKIITELRRSLRRKR